MTKNAKKPVKRKPAGVWIVMFLFGLLFGCIGIISITMLQNRTKGWVEIPAVISNFEHSYHSGKRSMWANVDYNYLGQEYTDVPLKFKSSSMEKGQRVRILVNPEDPEDIEFDQKRQNRFFYIFAVVGTILIVFSLYQCIMAWRGKSTWRTADEPPVILTPEEEKRESRNAKIFAGTVFVGMYLFFYCVMPFPVFLLAASLPAVSLVRWFINKLINMEDPDDTGQP